MANEFVFLDPFKRGIYLTPLNITGIVEGLVNNTTGYKAGDSAMAVDGFGVTKSAKITEGCYFYTGKKLTGAVNNSTGYVMGDANILVDGFTANDAGKLFPGDVIVITNTDTTRSLYKVKSINITSSGVITGIVVDPLTKPVSDNAVIEVLDNNFPYRVSKVTKVNNDMVKLNFFPKLARDIPDNSVIAFGDFVKINPGDFSDEAIKFTKSLAKSELKNQAGLTVKERRYLNAREIAFTCIDNTIENYSFFYDASVVVGNDGRFKIVEKDLGIVNAGNFRAEIFDLTDPDNPDKKITIPKALLSYETLEGGTGKEMFMKYPCKLACTPDENNILVTFGDELIDFA
jgi:hypothetical protein